MHTIEAVRRRFNSQLRLSGILLTMFDRRNSLSGLVEKDARDHFGDWVFDTTIPRNIRVSEAPSHGIPVLHVRSAVARARFLYRAWGGDREEGKNHDCRSRSKSMASKNTPPRLGRGLAALLGDVSMRRQTPTVARPSAPSRWTRSTPIRSSRGRISIPPNWKAWPNRSASKACCSRSSSGLIRRRRIGIQIVAGERRFRAAMQAGLNEIPAIQRDMDDSDAAVVALVENLQRQDLNADRRSRRLSTPADRFRPDP